MLIGIAVVCAALVFLLAGLLTSIIERKQEAKNPYVRLVEVSEETTDPAAWGVNWAREYDDYKRTAEVTQTRFGGSETLPAEKAGAYPWLTRMFAGYAFAIDYRDRRGHAYMLQDQEQTRRVTERPQPGLVPAVPHVGHPDVPAAWRGRRLQGLRRAQQAVVRRRARRGRQNGIVEPCARGDGAGIPARGRRAPGCVRGLPRSEEHGAARDEAGLHPRHPGTRGR